MAELSALEEEEEEEEAPMSKSMAELPLGCRFSPTDEELFTYLDNKVNDLKQPNVKLEFVKELDLYQCCPSDHPGLSKEECTYIFTSRVSRYQTRKISHRRTMDGKGYWKSQTGNKEFPLGTKNTLSYYLKAESKKDEKSTGWIMNEYALRPADSKVNEMKVLCRIYNREQKREGTCSKQESDSPLRDGRGPDNSRVKLLRTTSSQENQQKNTAASENEEIVCPNLCSVDDDSSEGNDQMNRSIPAKENTLSLIRKVDDSDQISDQHKNTTPTAENDVDMNLRLWPISETDRSY